MAAAGEVSSESLFPELFYQREVLVQRTLESNADAHGVRIELDNPVRAGRKIGEGIKRDQLYPMSVLLDGRSQVLESEVAL